MGCRRERHVHMDRAAITASNDPFAFSPPHLYRPLTFTSRKTTRGKPSKIETNKAREIERERGKGKQKRVLLLLVFLVGISSFQREFYCTQKRRRWRFDPHLFLVNQLQCSPIASSSALLIEVVWGREQAVMMEGFSPASPPRIFWNSRKRSGEAKILITVFSSLPPQSHRIPSPILVYFIYIFPKFLGREGRENYYCCW